MAKYINQKFCEITETEPVEGRLIRSDKMIRNDLNSWGYKYKTNSKRPFFEGHEREDVSKHRKEFIEYFVERKYHYYSLDDENKWINPKDKPTILIFHDESTFRSAEQFHSRWLKEGNEPFLNKGLYSIIKIFITSI